MALIAGAISCAASFAALNVASDALFEAEFAKRNNAIDHERLMTLIDCVEKNSVVQLGILRTIGIVNERIDLIVKERV